MPECEGIPETADYEEMAEFWDTHSLADYWDQTESVEFEVSPALGHHCLVPVDSDLLTRLQRIAQSRGVSTESLVNLLLEQRLHDIAGAIAK